MVSASSGLHTELIQTFNHPGALRIKKNQACQCGLQPIRTKLRHHRAVPLQRLTPETRSVFDDDDGLTY